MGQWFPPSICSAKHPVDVRAIHLKLPNEKQNEAILIESFCEWEGEQDGRCPIVSNVISILVDGFPMWVSCTRASGCLQSYMIYRLHLRPSPTSRTRTVTRAHTTWKETESKTEQCLNHTLHYMNSPRQT